MFIVLLGMLVADVGPDLTVITTVVSISDDGINLYYGLSFLTLQIFVSDAIRL